MDFPPLKLLSAGCYLILYGERQVCLLMAIHVMWMAPESQQRIVLELLAECL
jgi:hypothetical protein